MASHNSWTICGDNEIAAEFGRGSQRSQAGEGYPESQSPTDEGWDQGGSFFAGTDAMYTDDFNPKTRAPPNSFTDSYDPRRRQRFSAVPESLLDGELAEPDFDEDFAMQDLPPETPPAEYVIPRARVPPNIGGRRPPPPAQQEQQPGDDYSEHKSERSEDDQDQRPLPFRPDEQYDQRQSQYSDEAPERGPSRPLPPPQPVDLPTPVRTPETRPTQMGPSYGGMPPPPPGFAEMPRPSLPRIAGVRDPISTT